MKPTLENIKSMLKIFKNKTLVLNLLLLMLINLTPEFYDVSIYILTNVSGWTYLTLSVNYIFMSLVYVIVMILILNVFKGFRFNFLVYVSTLL